MNRIDTRSLYYKLNLKYLRFFHPQATTLKIVKYVWFSWKQSFFSSVL